MNARITKVARTGLVFGLSLILTNATALAQKSGGGGGGGGASKVTTTTVSVPLFGSYYGPGGSGSTVPTGSVTLTFDATQTLRSMSLSASNVHLPNGTIMHCVITDNGLTEPGFYYPVDVPQLIANLSLSAGQASISGSTANGDKVPLFGTVGSITVNAINSVTGQDMGVVLSGFYNLTTARKGGGRAGNP